MGARRNRAVRVEIPGIVQARDQAAEKASRLEELLGVYHRTLVAARDISQALQNEFATEREGMVCRFVEHARVTEHAMTDPLARARHFQITEEVVVQALSFEMPDVAGLISAIHATKPEALESAFRTNVFNPLVRAFGTLLIWINGSVASEDTIKEYQRQISDLNQRLNDAQTINLVALLRVAIAEHEMMIDRCDLESAAWHKVRSRLENLKNQLVPQIDNWTLVDTNFQKIAAETRPDSLAQLPSPLSDRYRQLKATLHEHYSRLVDLKSVTDNELEAIQQRLRELSKYRRDLESNRMGFENVLTYWKANQQGLIFAEHLSSKTKAEADATVLVSLGEDATKVLPMVPEISQEITDLTLAIQSFEAKLARQSVSDDEPEMLDGDDLLPPPSQDFDRGEVKRPTSVDLKFVALTVLYAYNKDAKIETGRTKKTLIAAATKARLVHPSEWGAFSQAIDDATKLPHAFLKCEHRPLPKGDKTMAIYSINGQRGLSTVQVWSRKLITPDIQAALTDMRKAASLRLTQKIADKRTKKS